MYRIQNIRTHSDGTTAPSRKSFPAHLQVRYVLLLFPGAASQKKFTVFSIHAHMCPYRDHLAGSGAATANNEACLALCQSKAGCNAMIRVNGKCYLKTISDTLESDYKAGAVAYRLCTGGSGNVIPAPAAGNDNGVASYEETLREYFTNGLNSCPRGASGALQSRRVSSMFYSTSQK